MTSHEGVEHVKLRMQANTARAAHAERIASAMNRLAHPDFPTELLLEVVEAVVLSQVGHWSVTGSHRLDILAASLFACPDGVNVATRRLLVQTAAKVLLNVGIIRIPADLDERRPPAYEIPPALMKQESQINRLAIDLNVPTGGVYNRELTISIGNMHLLAEVFPRIAVCTYLLHIEHDLMLAPSLLGPSVEVGLLYHPVYTWKRSIAPEGVRQWLVKCTLGDSLVEFIAAFAKSGPGKRKLIWFSRSSLFGWSGANKIGREVSLLTRVSSPDLICGGLCGRHFGQRREGVTPQRETRA